MSEALRDSGQAKEQPHPAYSKLILWTETEIQAHLAICLGTKNDKCLPGINALETVRAEKKSKQKLKRLGAKTRGRTDGLVKTNPALRGNRCPTKRELH